MDKVESDLELIQRGICLKYGAGFLSSPLSKMVAVAIETFDGTALQVNGLRHPIENEDVTNWYLWAGEYSEEVDFFKTIHVHHLLQICPKALDYLGLAPGWRFLIDGNGYEDVWYDEKLLLV